MFTQLLAPMLLYATLGVIDGKGNSVVPFLKNLYCYQISNFEAAIYLIICKRKVYNVLMKS